MTVFQAFDAALSATPYPVTQRPVKGDAPVYLTFWEIMGHPTAHASNRAQRITHTVQVDIFARQAVAPELDVVRKALTAAGIRVGSWGPADYESDTGWHHMPITCYYAEINEQEV